MIPLLKARMERLCVVIVCGSGDQFDEVQLPDDTLKAEGEVGRLIHCDMHKTGINRGSAGD